ncbi:MAG: hypothetical protein GY820_21140 [Gammaproteobacteria bacterium]|nr:hypothetical protein [Gammaproteobacteria bacterium]
MNTVSQKVERPNISIETTAAIADEILDMLIDSSTHPIEAVLHRHNGSDDVVTWEYNGNKIESHDDLYPECTDFVYVITFEGGAMYIGKKAVRAMRKYPPLKGKKRCRRKMKNLPFENYCGSFDNVKNFTPVKKEILYQCSSRKSATYLEVATLIGLNAIFNDCFINENISGTFFKNSLDGLLYKGEQYE